MLQGKVFLQPGLHLNSFLVSSGPPERGLWAAVQHLPQTAENQDGVSHQGEHPIPVPLYSKGWALECWGESDSNAMGQDRGWQSCPSAVSPMGPLRCGHPSASMKCSPDCQCPSLAWIKIGPRASTLGWQVSWWTRAPWTHLDWAGNWWATKSSKRPPPSFGVHDPFQVS